MTNWWKQQLNKYGKVDGVDFVPLTFNPELQKEPFEIYQTNSYEELTAMLIGVPKSNWCPWRVVDGVKFYLDREGNPIVVNSEYEWVEKIDKEEYWVFGFDILAAQRHPLMQSIVVDVVKKLAGFIKKPKKNI